jgi:hypothetical protein
MLYPIRNGTESSLSRLRCTLEVAVPSTDLALNILPLSSVHSIIIQSASPNMLLADVTIQVEVRFVRESCDMQDIWVVLH